MPNFVTVTSQFETDLADTSKFTTRAYTLLVDTTGDDSLLSSLDDLTSYLENGVQLAGQGQLEGSSNEAVSNRWTATLRNNDGTFTEGDYAGALCGVEAQIGSESAVRIFTGYITDEGAKIKRVGQKKTATIEMRDASYKLARRTMAGTILANYKISDATTPTTSLVHYLALQLGIAAADVDAGTITDTKTILPIKDNARPWSELQNLAQQFLAVLRFDAVGDLSFESRFESGYAALTAQWNFVDGENANISELTGSQDPITVNRCRTKYDEHESLGAGYTIYKNTENYDADADEISIVVASGEYWPGGTSATDVATLNYKDPDSGEKLLATTVTTPTIGTSGSEDIVGSGVLTLTSFNGSTSATKQLSDGSQIILYNGTGSSVTITKFQLRGTAYRTAKEIVVEELDGTVSNEYDYVTKEIPGTYAISESQAGESCGWWVERGKTAKKRYQIKTYWLPHVVEGALVNLTLADGTNIDCQIERWRHSRPRRMADVETTLEVREVFSYSYATSPGVRIDDVSSPVGSSVRKAQTDISDRVTYTELEEGYDSGVTLVTPTLRATVYNRNVHLEWDTQRALQNLDYYELQRKKGTGSYSAIRGATENLTDASTVDLPAFDTSGGSPIDTSYTYRVRRVTADAATSSWSNEASVTIEPIKADEIVAQAITDAELADDAVTSAKLINDAVIAAKIAAGAVEATALATNAVTSDKILADAVTQAKVAAGAIDTTELAALAVSAAKIANGAVGATQIATNAVTSDKILADAVTQAKVAAGAIDTTELAALAVEAANIASSAVSEDKIAAGAVVAAKIAAGAIVAGKIAAGAVDTDELAANAITAAKIGAAAVVAGKIGAGAVDTDELAANAITAAKIAAGTITATEIATDAITSDKILASAITAAKIAAATITANEIATGTITSAEITSGTITASELSTSSNFLFTGAIGSETSSSPSDGDVRTYHGKDPAGSQLTADPFEFAIKRYNGTQWEYIAKISARSSGDNADGLVQGRFNASEGIGSLWGNFWTEVEPGAGTGLTAGTKGGVAYDGSSIIAVSGAGVRCRFIKSTDGGDTWSGWVTADESIGAPTQMVSPASGVFVASCLLDGILRTANSGTSWTQINPGGSSEDLWGIAVGDTYVVAVGDNGTIVYSDDDGATWSTVATTTFGTDDVKGVGFGNGRFIAVGGASTADSHVAYADETAITSWTEITTHGLGSNMIEAALWHDGIWVISGYGGSIAYSDDDGATWTSVGPGTGTFVEAMAVDGYRVVTSGTTAYQSTDNGRSWQEHAGFPELLSDFVETDDGRVFIIPVDGAVALYEAGWAEAGAGIIARGENTNGTYIKFSDGTMVCWQFKESSTSTDSAKTFYWTLPSTFVNNTYAAFGVWDDASTGGILGIARLETAQCTTSSARMRTNTRNGTISDVSTIAIGSWK